ncbi:hypothetical protein [Desertivirga xinjiangensis]|uniref:hypothetical protein n=1 Tax=Desertivirga xinjiangensis TaxID=539206 RepID=UPI00210DD584|nr:hypothetical protein [Pedobacter xinjiangensis]
MKVDVTRIILCAKDIENITGRKRTYAQKTYKDICVCYGRKKYQGITVDQFCEYMGLRREDIEKFL